MEFRILKRKNKLILPIIIVVLLTAVFVLFPRLALAQDLLGGAVANVLAFFIMPIIELLGGLIAVVVRLLIDVAQYNGFIDSPVVNIGWVIIRDICNMLFVLIMIFIAFATVLKIEKYSYTKLLGAVFMAAILVNFSKLICGVIIDFSQVIMLTFVNAFSAAAEGNFINMLGLNTLMQLKSEGAVSGANTAGALILALVLSVVALFAIFTMLVILLYRIIHLWFLVMMSPLAFIKNALPINIPGIGGNWWEDFGKEVVVGPLLAFFIWLSLSVVQGGTNLLFPTTTVSAGVKDISATASLIGDSQNLLAYIVGIFLLFISITEAQKLSAYGGGFAGKMSGKLQQWGKGAAAMPFKPIKDRYQAARAGWQESRSARKRARMAPFARLGQRMGEMPTQLKGELKAGTIGALGEIQARGGKKYYDMSKASRSEAERLRKRAETEGGPMTTKGQVSLAEARMKEQEAEKYELMAKKRDVAGQVFRSPVSFIKGLGKKEESVEDLNKQIQEKEQTLQIFKPSDDQINARALSAFGNQTEQNKAKAKEQLEKETREKPEYIEAQDEIIQLKQSRDQKRTGEIRANLMPDEINAEIEKLKIKRHDLEIKAAEETDSAEAKKLTDEAVKLNKPINELTGRLETARRATTQGEVISRFGAEELAWVQKANVLRYEDAVKKIPKEIAGDEKKITDLLRSALSQTQGGAALLKLKDLHKDKISKRQTDLGFDQYVEKHTGKSVKSWVEQNNIPQEALENHGIQLSVAKGPTPETPQPVIDKIFGDQNMQKYLDKLSQSSAEQDFKSMEKSLNNIAWLIRLQTKAMQYEDDVNIELIGNLNNKLNNLTHQLKSIDPSADQAEKEKLAKEIRELADKLKGIKNE